MAEPRQRRMEMCGSMLTSLCKRRERENGFLANLLLETPHNEGKEGPMVQASDKSVLL